MSSTLECLPTGICSWGFRLIGAPSEVELGFGGIRESGSLTIDGCHYEIQKGGFLSGEWRLMRNGRAIVTAKKMSAFFWEFGLRWEGHSGVLTSGAAFSRSMRFHGGQHDFKIEPVHPFTRRAIIDGRYKDLRVVSFAFWLTALMWMRSSRASAA